MKKKETAKQSGAALKVDKATLPAKMATGGKGAAVVIAKAPKKPSK